MEKVAAAAIRVGTQIYIGTTHFEASEKYINLNEVVAQSTEDGYVTDLGRFVDREEAFQIAVRNGQAHGDLADPLRNMAFYGTNRPRLDSSIIENYGVLRAAHDFI
jgi:hypothetical protein